MKRTTSQSLIIALTFMSALISSVAFGRDWGAEERFAVVNPIVRSELADVLDISGEWDFKTDNAIAYRLGVGHGVWGNFSYNWSEARKIRVPGVWEAQGVGEPGPSRPWDPVWDKGDWDLRNRYVGHALYHKEVDIPASWEGKRVWLKIGGVGADAYIWVNGERAAYVDTYCGARKYDVTSLVKPGEKTEIIALVRNDVPHRVGLPADTERFGGFYRNVELEATPDVYVDDVWARGFVHSKSADVRVYVKYTTEDGKAAPNYEDELSPGQRELCESVARPGIMGRILGAIEGFSSIDVTIKTLDGEVVGTETRSNEIEFSNRGLGALPFRFNVPIKDCKLWTPESPNLYLADVVLRDENGNAIHGWTERFGVREFKVVGDQFFLNGQPYFLRGGGDHNYDQIELFELGDHKQFHDHIALYKRAGFNYMRFHTHSPLPEYFEAADELGLLLQPELPYYHDVPCEGFEFNPKREMFESFRTNRRYVSFATYSYGNEGFLGEPLDQEMYQWVKKYDPDRLVLHQDGGIGNRPTVNSDFVTNGTSGASIINPWTPGDHDALTAPFVAHEYLNLAIKMDPRLEPKFTGIRVSPVSVAKWREKLERLGLDETWGANCLAAAEKLQGIYQKRGLESARRDPKCDGYIFWSLVDASIPQGDCVAAQGYLDSFWNPRPNGIQPEEFYRFNGPTALLTETNLAAPILTPGTDVHVDVKLSHYDATAIPAGTLTWKFATKDGAKVLAQGEIKTNEIPQGFAGVLKSFDLTVPDGVLDEAAALDFTVALEGTSIVNSWEYWYFPKRDKPSLDGFAVSPSLLAAFQEIYDGVTPIPGDPSQAPENDDVWIVTPEDPAYAVGIETGRKLVVISRASDRPNVSLGWWALGTQVGAAIANSPAFNGYPNSAVMDELWFRLVRVGAPDLKNQPLGDAYEPLFVGEGRDSYYLYLGQTKFGDAKILASFALDLTQNVPESNALLDALLKYAKSDAFNPKSETKTLRVKKYALPDDAVWGFDKMLKVVAEPPQPWLTLYEDGVLYSSCRQNSLDDELVWQTAPRTIKGETTAFEFVGALGYWSESKTDGFLMTVDGGEQIKFDLPESGDLKPGAVQEWKSEDGKATLSFKLGRINRPGPDYFGTFRLEVASDRLDANAERTTISVKSLGDSSRRWFTVNEYRGLLVDLEMSQK